VLEKGNYPGGAAQDRQAVEFDIILFEQNGSDRGTKTTESAIKEKLA